MTRFMSFLLLAISYYYYYMASLYFVITDYSNMSRAVTPTYTKSDWLSVSA